LVSSAWIDLERAKLLFTTPALSECRTQVQ
jgi:hypothetical protein